MLSEALRLKTNFGTIWVDLLMKTMKLKSGEGVYKIYKGVIFGVKEETDFEEGVWGLISERRDRK